MIEYFLRCKWTFSFFFTTYFAYLYRLFNCYINSKYDINLPNELSEQISVSLGGN